MCNRLGINFSQELKVDDIRFILTGGTSVINPLDNPVARFELGIKFHLMSDEVLSQTLIALLKQFELNYIGSKTYMRYQLDEYDILIEAVEELMRKLTNKDE